MTRKAGILVVAALLLAACGTPGAEDDPAGTPTDESEAASQSTPDPTIVALAADFQLPALGSSDAPIVIYEFSDYMCPYCRKFAIETYPELITEYIEPGEVSLIFIDFPLQNHGLPALMSAEATHCASEQDGFWAMHDAVFVNQASLQELIPEQEEAPVNEALVELATETGLDGEAIGECLAEQKYRPIVLSLFKEAIDSGVQATPTILIGERAVPGFLPFEDLAVIIEEELAKSES